MFLKLFKLVFALTVILGQFSFPIAGADSYKDTISDGGENLERHVRQTKQEGCKIPDYPLHTKYEALGFTSEPGSYVSNFGVIKTNCESDYSLDPMVTEISYCVQDDWIPPLGVCTLK